MKKIKKDANGNYSFKSKILNKIGDDNLLWDAIHLDSKFIEALNKESTSKLEQERKNYKKSQHHEILWNIYLNLQKRLGTQPTKSEVWNELTNNTRAYDAEGIIEEVNIDEFEWYDSKGSKHTFRRGSLDAFLSRRRKIDP